MVADQRVAEVACCSGASTPISVSTPSSTAKRSAPSLSGSFCQSRVNSRQVPTPPMRNNIQIAMLRRFRAADIDMTPTQDVRLIGDDFSSSPGRREAARPGDPA